jgi:hypothetical protein
MALQRARGAYNLASSCTRQGSLPSIRVYHVIASPSLFEQSVQIPPAFQRKRRRIEPWPLQPSRLFSTSPSISTDRPQEHHASIPWPSYANPTPYEIFAIPRTASQKEIKARYFQLVKQHHPDHATHASSVERFRKVVDAYKILGSPSKRLEWDRQHPAHEQEGPTGTASEFRRPWSGSRLSRRKTTAQGPPPSGGWSFRSAGRVRINHDYSGTMKDADNEHFNYERHFARNLEQEKRIKRRMDELHAHQVEFERMRAVHASNLRYGLTFTGIVFFILMMFARALYPG